MACSTGDYTNGMRASMGYGDVVHTWNKAEYQVVDWISTQFIMVLVGIFFLCASTAY
jgi:hypothetical protein